MMLVINLSYFTKFGRQNPPKMQFLHVFDLASGFGVYVKALVDFKAFYFFISVLVFM